MKETEVRAALEDFPRETLADALSMLLAQDKAPAQAAAGTDNPKLSNFAQAVLFLKKHYDFPELDYFSTEADLVYVRAGERRILLTERLTPGVPDWSNEGSTDETPSVPVSGPAGGANPSRDEAGQAGGRFSNLEI
jgi:hypothetical protein